MNTRDTLALMAGLGTGYMNQQDKERNLKIQQDNIDWQNNLRQRDQAAYDLAQKQRADLIAAAAPVSPTADMGSASTGTDPTAAPTAQPLPAGGGSGFGGVGTDPSAQPAPVVSTYSVGDKSGLSQSDAAALAAQQNAPTAQMARMAGALRLNGDPVAAAQLEAQARQSQLGQLQLDAAQQEANARVFNAGLTNAISQGHQAIANFLTKSGGDGHDGGLKAELVPSADGKTVQYKLTKPDGTTTLTDSFSNDQNGAIQAGFGYQSLMTPAMLDAHNQAQIKDKREQQLADQTGAYQQGMLKNNAEKIWYMGEAAQARAEAAASRAATAAQTTKDPVLQAQLGITGKMLEQTTEQIARLRASPDYDPAKPPKGEASLLASQAAMQQKILDLVGGKAHAGGVPAVFNAPPPSADRLPPGAHHIPGFVTPPIVGASASTSQNTPPALMMADPRLRASADAQRAKEAQSVTAGMNFQRLMQEAQAAQMTHGAN